MMKKPHNGKRPPRKIPSPQNLANVALHYLGRYAASEASLRGVLNNRIRRAAMDNPDFAGDHEKQRTLRSVIETIIETHKRTGILNDAVFAEGKINSLRRAGKSRRAIQQKLGAKGIKGDILTAAFAQHEDGAQAQDVEMKAAIALARKRRLGPFRQKPADEDRKRKDFAALARAGFSSDIARRVLKAAAPEDWLD
jgi:regulatory protein